MPKMLRLTEEEFSRMSRKASHDQVFPKPAPGVSGKDATSSAAIVGSGIDAPARQQGSGVVMLPYPISANRYWRNFRGRMVVSKEAEEYKAKVIWSFFALDITPTSKPVSLTMKLHPKLTKTGKSSRTLIDLDNCIKVCLDALQGVLYVNDNQVIKLTAEVGEPVDGGGLSVGITNGAR